MKSGHVTNLIFVRAQAGKVARLERALKKLAQEARKEAGSVIYEVHHSASEREEYLVYQIWRSKEDLEAHMKEAAGLAFLQEAPEVIDAASNLRLFVPVDVVRI